MRDLLDILRSNLYGLLAAVLLALSLVIYHAGDVEKAIFYAVAAAIAAIWEVNATLQTNRRQ